MQKENEQIDEGVLFAESIFGANEKRGFVKLSYGISFEILITPDNAREFARSVFEAADAADTDEFLIKWLDASVGVKSEKSRVQVLRDFRKMREAFRKRDLTDNEEK